MATLDLDVLRGRLNDRREAVLARLRSAAESLDELDRSQPIEAEEEAQELNIARPQETLDQRNRSELAEIDEALARIERGEYGICQTCGERIEADRLLALPSAVQCLDCAEAAERRAREAHGEPEHPIGTPPDSDTGTDV
jgi:RNA polymerase-binding transcription factor